MANSDLKGKTWKIPSQYIRKLRKNFNDFKGSRKAEGYIRLKNLLSKGFITYENLKFIKHTLEKNKNNEELYKLNGGKEFERWINDTLSTARKSIESRKKSKKESGMANAYKKSHEKDSSANPTKIRTPKLHKSMSINDLNNNNMNYENIRITKVIITEAQYRSLTNNVSRVKRILKESKKTEEAAAKILQKFNIESPEEIISKLKQVDSSKNQVNLPVMAFYYANGYTKIDDLGVIFGKYNDLRNKNQIAPIQLTNKGVQIQDKLYNDFLKFSEFVDGVEQLNKKSETDYRKITRNVEPTKNKPVWSGNGIDIFYGNDFKTCIEYSTGALTGKKYSFCIGNPSMRMWQSYRDTQISTFYFIVDWNRIKENEDGTYDFSDPLHLVVFDRQPNGISLTDDNNTTGNIAEYGRDVNAYVKYLKSKGVPVEKMVNVPKSDKEKEEDRLLGNNNSSLEWFMKLPNEMKSKYIGRGHILSDEQFDFLMGG